MEGKKPVLSGVEGQVFLPCLVEHVRLPHAEIPQKHQYLRNNLRNDGVHKHPIDETVENQFRPYEPADGNEDDHGDFLGATVLALKYPQQTKEMIPSQSQHIGDECRKKIVETQEMHECRIGDQIHDGRRAADEEVAEELDTGAVGAAENEMTHK